MYDGKLNHFYLLIPSAFLSSIIFLKVSNNSISLNTMNIFILNTLDIFICDILKPNKVLNLYKICIRNSTSGVNMELHGGMFLYTPCWEIFKVFTTPPRGFEPTLPKVRYSQGPLCPRSAMPKVPYSQKGSL